MQCVVRVEDLQKKISIAERFTGKNSTLPILGNIFFNCTDQKIEIIATNLEIACVLTTQAKISHEGSFTVPARSFSSYIQTLHPDTKVILEEKEGVLHIESDGIKTKLLTIPPKDFPIIPKIKHDVYISIPKNDFQNTLKQVISAASISQIKPELNGVYVSWNKNDHILTCAATDTFRLSEKKLFLLKEICNDFSFILPSKSVQELIHFDVPDDYFKCSYGESQIMITCGENEFISNTIHAAFPSYTSIIPKTFETTIEIQKESIIDAVRSSSFFSSKLQDIKLRAETNDSLELYAANNEIGETTISLPAHIKGKPLQVSFNYKFFLDGLVSLEGDIVILSLNNESSPVLLKAADTIPYLYILMPIRGM